MKKLMYYNKIPKGNLNHEICIQSWGIRQAFTTYAEAEKLSLALQETLRSLKLLCKSTDMDTPKFNVYPYSLTDMDRVQQAGIKVHPLIEKALLGNSVVQGRTPLSVRNPTIAEMVNGYAAWLDTDKAVKKKRPLPRLRRDRSGNLPKRFQFWIDGSLANVRASNIRFSMVQAELDKIFGTMSKNTYNKYNFALSACWTRAMSLEDCDIKTHLIQKLDASLDIKDVANTPSYSLEEMIRIVAMCYADDARLRHNNTMPLRHGPEGFVHLGALVEVAAYTCIRKAFVESLKVSEIKTISGKMYISKHMKGHKFVEVPVVPEAVAVIEKQLRMPEVINSGYLFPYKGYYSSGWYSRFRDLLEDNDLLISPKPFHSFRAYGATQYAIAGYKVKAIAEIMGVTDKVADGYIDRSKFHEDFHANAHKIPALGGGKRAHLTVVGES